MPLTTDTSIRLVTPIPGPVSRELQRRREASVPRGVASALPVFVRRALGATIENVDGNRLLDFAGGIGCQNEGHCVPEVTAAIHEQSEHFVHTCFMVTPYEGYVQLVENAVKIARHFTRRQAVMRTPSTDALSWR